MSERKLSLLVVFLICLGIASLAIVVNRKGWMEPLEVKTIDVRFELRHAAKKLFQGKINVSDQVVLAGIDHFLNYIGINMRGFSKRS